MTEREQSELLVFEYGGTARSGKGTIVGHLEEFGDHIASEETGADYRAVTRALLAGADRLNRISGSVSSYVTS